MESATRIFEALANRYRWILITNRESDFTRRWRSLGAIVRMAPLNPDHVVFKRILDRVRWEVAVLAQMTISKPDMIHVNDIRAYRAIHRVASVGAKNRLLFTIRDTKMEDEVYDRHWRRAVRQCSRIVVLSNEMRQLVSRRLNVSDERIRSINSIVDLQKFAPLSDRARLARRQELGIADGEFSVGIVGAVQEKKEQLAFIEHALPVLLKENSSIRVHFLGDFTPERSDYAKRCQEAVLAKGFGDRVQFHGHISDVSKWYPALDCVAVASRREGLARCMIEAMGCGTPVVSFAVCSAREMLEATDSGVVVPLGDHEALVNAILSLAADRATAKSKGLNGRLEAFQRFDQKKVSAEFVSLYEEVMKGD